MRHLKTPFSGTWGVVALLLTSVFMLEVYFAVGATGDLPPAAIVAPVVGAPIEASANLIQSDAAWGAVVLSRPILAQSRRPMQSPVIPVEMPRLSGIMITPAERMAVLVPPKGGAIIVAKNSRFGPFTVRSITSNDVTLEGPDGLVVLRADFSHRGQAGASVPATTLPPGAIDLSEIRAPLPDAATWNGPPMVN